MKLRLLPNYFEENLDLPKNKQLEKKFDQNDTLFGGQRIVCINTDERLSQILHYLFNSFHVKGNLFARRRRRYLCQS